MSKITEAARGRGCVRCGIVDGTVVAAHINGPLAAKLGRGMGQKPDDVFAAHLCHRCHDIADGRILSSAWLPEHVERDWPELVLLTIARLRKDGVL